MWGGKGAGMEGASSQRSQRCAWAWWRATHVVAVGGGAEGGQQVQGHGGEGDKAEGEQRPGGVGADGDGASEAGGDHGDGGEHGEVDVNPVGTGQDGQVNHQQRHGDDPVNVADPQEATLAVGVGVLSAAQGHGQVGQSSDGVDDGGGVVGEAAWTEERAEAAVTQVEVAVTSAA